MYKNIFGEDMRVIAGKAKRLQLKTAQGMNTRPTQDRTKETLFNMINNDIYGCRFLDLFSGSGGIGIEAASRGAEKCVLVENDRQAYNCIMDNLKYTKLEENAEVMYKSVENALDILNRRKEIFDFIFMDPPYNQLLEKSVLNFLKSSEIIDTYTTIIVEASNETKFDYLENMGFELVKEKIYKTNKHVFIKIGGG